jgi:hypothetical protein
MARVAGRIGRRQVLGGRVLRGTNSQTVQIRPDLPVFPSLCWIWWSICRDAITKRIAVGKTGNNRPHMSHLISKPQFKLRKAPQPPLSHRGAVPDSDRARRPSLAQPAATKQELTPGDRVEGLGNFGKPTGEVGTVEQSNDEDAIVKWDDDGRMRLHQPWLKKI